MAKIGTFDVLREMCRRNMDVRLSTIDNITHLQLNNKKETYTKITIGMSGNVMGIADNEFVGGMLLANREQFNQVEKELKETPDGK